MAYFLPGCASDTEPPFIEQTASRDNAPVIIPTVPTAPPLCWNGPALWTSEETTGLLLDSMSHASSIRLEGQGPNVVNS
jgi:hypothetical protein